VLEKEIALASTTFNTGYPQYEIAADELKTKQIGVHVKGVMMVVQGFLNKQGQNPPLCICYMQQCSALGRGEISWIDWFYIRQTAIVLLQLVFR